MVGRSHSRSPSRSASVAAADRPPPTVRAAVPHLVLAFPTPSASATATSCRPLPVAARRRALHDGYSVRARALPIPSLSPPQPTPRLDCICGYFTRYTITANLSEPCDHGGSRVRASQEPSLPWQPGTSVATSACYDTVTCLSTSKWARAAPTARSAPASTLSAAARAIRSCRTRPAGRPQAPEGRKP